MLDGMEEGSYRFRDQIWITGLGRGGVTLGNIWESHVFFFLFRYHSCYIL